MSDFRSHARSRRLNREILGPKGSKPCAYCGAPATEVDHRIPVARGGRHERANLVPACRRCNASKGKRAAPSRGLRRSVFSVGGTYTPHLLSISLPTRRYATIRGDFTRQAADDGAR